MVLLPSTQQGNTEEGVDVPLATRQKTPIPNTQGHNIQPRRLQFVADFWSKQKREASIQIIDGVYNCTGLVFGARRTTINICHVRWILEEDEYKQIPDPQHYGYMQGDIVLYGTQDEITHVGIVWSVEVDDKGIFSKPIILSKWGETPEFLHPLAVVPDEYGMPVEFWRHKRHVRA